MQHQETGFFLNQSRNKWNC